MKNILIAGINGSLGNFFLNFYLSKNFKVIGLSKSKIKFKHKNLISFKIDLSDQKKVKSFYLKLKRKFKKIDYILSCVGRSSLNEKDKNFWINGINDNLLSNIYLVEEYIENFSKLSNNCKIILISSIAGVAPINAPLSYSLAKSALNYYCKLKSSVLAKKNITINNISPGNILMKNNLWHKKIKLNKKKTLKYINENVPLKSFCEPQSILDICNLLFSKSGDFITGSNFLIDGGQVHNVKK